MCKETKMNDDSQKFFDALKEIRGILPLNEHLLNLLVEMNGGMDADVQKFLCMYFSLLDARKRAAPS